MIVENALEVKKHEQRTKTVGSMVGMVLLVRNIMLFYIRKTKFPFGDQLLPPWLLHVHAATHEIVKDTRKFTPIGALTRMLQGAKRMILRADAHGSDARGRLELLSDNGG